MWLIKELTIIKEIFLPSEKTIHQKVTNYWKSRIMKSNDITKIPNYGEVSDSLKEFWTTVNNHTVK